jgi:hypothetical protein
MFQTKVVEKIKRKILLSTLFFPRKSCRLRRNVQKYGTAKKATDDNRQKVLCTPDDSGKNTHSRYLILIAFPWQK